jgi:hypothetical protein
MAIEMCAIFNAATLTNFLKRLLRNLDFATLPEVMKAINACFDRWRRPNDMLRRPCFIT